MIESDFFTSIFMLFFSYALYCLMRTYACWNIFFPSPNTWIIIVYKELTEILSEYKSKIQNEIQVKLYCYINLQK